MSVNRRKSKPSDPESYVKNSLLLYIILCRVFPKLFYNKANFPEVKKDDVPISFAEVGGAWCVCVVRNFVAFAWSRGVVGSAGKRERLTFLFFSRIRSIINYG